MINCDIRIELRYLLYPILLILIFPLFVLITVIKSILKLFRNVQDIRGEVAVVTGAAQGLGRELAIVLAKRGCQIAVVDIQEDSANATAEFINKSYGVKTKAYKVDVSNHQQLVEFHSQVTNDFGDVTILINNAGLIIFDNPNNSPKEVQQLINVNVTSNIWINQLFLPRMKALNRGHIVAISSMSALFPVPNLQVYSATKSALRAYMAALRVDLKMQNYGIKLTTVMPTFLNTHKPTLATLQAIRWSTSLYPLLDGSNVAEQAIANMLQGSEQVTLPHVYAIMYKVYEFLPSWARDWLWRILMFQVETGNKKGK